MSKPIRVGLLRLVDSAPVIVAEADGLFRDQGIDVQISIEPSWSNIADKLAYGVLDAAVMLPPLALAACAGLRGPKARLVVPMSLSQGGNAIVAEQSGRRQPDRRRLAPRLRLLDWLRAQPTRPRFAVVHAFSTHNLLLRYWLASGGADPDRDIETVVIPPENVVEALAAGSIAGFCAGAPWGDVAERQQAGRILIGTSVDLAVPSGEMPVRRGSLGRGQSRPAAPSAAGGAAGAGPLRPAGGSSRHRGVAGRSRMACGCRRKPAGRRCPAGRGRS